jgi:hypothetical protein
MVVVHGRYDEARPHQPYTLDPDWPKGRTPFATGVDQTATRQTD